MTDLLFDVYFFIKASGTYYIDEVKAASAAESIPRPLFSLLLRLSCPINYERDPLRPVSGSTASSLTVVGALPLPGLHAAPLHSAPAGPQSHTPPPLSGGWETGVLRFGFREEEEEGGRIYSIFLKKKWERKNHEKQPTRLPLTNLDALSLFELKLPCSPRDQFGI